MTSPYLSVLMPVYNSEKYLSEAIESILNQTFKDFEFIIVNDGSTDMSESILQKFAKRDRRIQVITKANGGVVSAINRALTLARGKYIAHMDSDDMSLPDRFAQQIQFLEGNPEYVAVGSQVTLIDPEGMPIQPFSLQINHEDIDREHLAGRGGAMCNPSTMFRHEALQKVGLHRPETGPAHDFDMFLRLAEIGKLTNLPTTLLKYRMHQKSLGHSRRLEQINGANLAVKEAHQRRGLTPPKLTSTDNYTLASVAKLHRKWAWWALAAGNIKTAKKHALLALGKNPWSVKSWQAFACVVRGY